MNNSLTVNKIVTLIFKTNTIKEIVENILIFISALFHFVNSSSTIIIKLSTFVEISTVTEHVVKIIN